MKDSYDAVVIGSGFGGAIVAYRLAAAGRSVLVLEQGARWTKDHFPRTIGQTGGAFWQGRAPAGFLEYRAFKNIDVLQGVGVGGGSLHYFNVGLRAPARVFGRWPKPLGRDRLDPYYDLVAERLDSKPLAPPAGRELPPRTQAFVAAARAANGHEPALVPIAVHTGADRTNWAGVAQSGCVYCGNCMLGCHVQAKNTLDITYIADAERRHGAEVMPLHKVDGLRPATDRGEGYWVDYRVITPTTKETVAKGAVHGKRVVVAAGALGSTELLLRCRDQLATLPRLSAALGTRFSGNGDMLFAGALAARTPIDPAQGPSITAVVDCSTKDNAIHIQDLGFPDPLLWMLEGLLPPDEGRFVQLVRLAGRYIARSLGIGGHKSRITDQIGGLLGGSGVNRLLPYLGMGTDAADGRMRLADDQLDIVWSHRGSRRMLREMEDALARISAETGGKYMQSFLWRWPFRKLVTAHPLGGCVMGDSDADSVVDHTGQVWGHPGLYVTDGASIPAALSVNPSLTIGAVAERAAQWMIHGRERAAGDPS